MLRVTRRPEGWSFWLCQHLSIKTKAHLQSASWLKVIIQGDDNLVADFTRAYMMSQIICESRRASCEVSLAHHVLLQR